ncbi:hypothetical protein GGI08_008861, partial [Coemansia sp. S2]
LKGRDHWNPSSPIALKHLRFYTSATISHTGLPMMLASTLVHLTLGEIRVDWLWNRIVCDYGLSTRALGYEAGCHRWYQLHITMPSVFARNITSLKLEDHTAMNSVGLVLLQLP